MLTLTKTETLNIILAFELNVYVIWWLRMEVFSVLSVTRPDYCKVFVLLNCKIILNQTLLLANYISLLWISFLWVKLRTKPRQVRRPCLETPNVMSDRGSNWAIGIIMANFNRHVNIIFLSLKIFNLYLIYCNTAYWMVKPESSYTSFIAVH